jgi:hypothetical protein
MNISVSPKTSAPVNVRLHTHLSSRQGTKTKQKVRIYDRFLKVHGDKEDADIIKN